MAQPEEPLREGLGVAADAAGVRVRVRGDEPYAHGVILTNVLYARL
jgi:hypothetical protein